MGDHKDDSKVLTDITGEVKWFDPRKGFGFIIGPDGQDIFVHYTVIDGEGFRVLKDGDQINYDAEHNEKGWRATRAIRPDGQDGSDGSDDQDGHGDDAPEIVVPKRTYTRTPRR